MGDFYWSIVNGRIVGKGGTLSVANYEHDDRHNEQDDRINSAEIGFLTIHIFDRSISFR
jgi:hypothetical protein